jgi:8-oxo-dGTP diphosphatase
MKEQAEKLRAPILAAGGIVMRGGPEPLVAIVQLRKCNSWVLPKGKLDPDESALAAARREVLEEVGHRVHIHEFLGTISYDVGDRVKVVKFWRMRAVGEPARRRSTRDVKAVQWLPFDHAIEKLTRSREQAFLESVAPVVMRAMQASARRIRPAENSKTLRDKALREAAKVLAGKDSAPAIKALPQAAIVKGPPSSARDGIVDTVRAWLGRNRRSRAA